MFPANTDFQILAGFTAFFNSDRDQLTDSIHIDDLERIDGKDLFTEVFRKETTDIVPRKSEGHLCQVIRTKGEELGDFCNFICRERCPWYFDHGTYQMGYFIQPEFCFNLSIYFIDNGKLILDFVYCTGRS